LEAEALVCGNETLRSTIADKTAVNIDGFVLMTSSC
jgi:hypothetical protein